MALTKEQKQIVADITKLRTTCLVHRYLYYVKAETIISDQQYDIFERKLKALVEANPELEYQAAYSTDCPTKNVGSSLADEYQRSIEQLAESLLLTHKKEEQWKRVVSIRPISHALIAQHNLIRTGAMRFRRGKEIT